MTAFRITNSQIHFQAVGTCGEMYLQPSNRWRNRVKSSLLWFVWSERSGSDVCSRFFLSVSIRLKGCSLFAVVCRPSLKGWVSLTQHSAALTSNLRFQGSENRRRATCVWVHLPSILQKTYVPASMGTNPHPSSPEVMLRFWNSRQKAHQGQLGLDVLRTTVGGWGGSWT